MELKRLLLAALLWTGPPRSVQAQGADFLLPDSATPLPPALSAALAGLRAPALATHIAALASPRMQGRGLGSRGLERAAEYISAELAGARVAPFGDPTRTGAISWYQAVPFQRLLRPSATVTVRAGNTGQELELNSGPDGLFPKLVPGTLTLPLVFAGHGIRETAMGHDDFQGREVQGKAVLFLGGLPPGEAWRKPPFPNRYAAGASEDRYEARIELLRGLGAAAAVAIEADFPAAGEAAKQAAQPAFLDPPAAPPADRPLLLRIPAERGGELRRLLDAGGAATLTLACRGELRPAAGRNVLAVLPGSDPTLKREAVVLGAHYDHLGQRDGVTFPGADDNASGVAALLEIARAFAAAPRRPKRTLVFAFWTGEEEAKFGSSHYVRQPRWPLARTVAYLNLDMIGHPWTRQELGTLVAEARLEHPEAFLAKVNVADFIEPGLAKGAPWLGPLLARAGGGLGLPLHLDWTDGLHGGSDYQPFARAGVPFVRFFGNYFPDYHKAGDTAERLDPAQALKITRLACATAWLLAER